MDKECACRGEHYTVLNPKTYMHSGLEISIRRGGALRVRYYTNPDSDKTFDTQDVVNIKYCPMCRRKLTED